VVDQILTGTDNPISDIKRSQMKDPTINQKKDPIINPIINPTTNQKKDQIINQTKDPTKDPITNQKKNQLLQIKVTQEMINRLVNQVNKTKTLVDLVVAKEPLQGRHNG